MRLAVQTTSFTCDIENGLAHLALNQPDRGKDLENPDSAYPFAAEHSINQRMRDYAEPRHDGKRDQPDEHTTFDVCEFEALIIFLYFGKCW